MKEAEANAFDVILITIEVGSQVFEFLNGLHQISDIIIVTNKQPQCLLGDMS